MTRPSSATHSFERLPLFPGRPLLRYTIALILSLLAVAIRWQLSGSLPPGYPFVTFFPPVILTAFLLGRGAGVLTAALCGLSARFFFITPVGSFALDRASMIAMAFYCAVVTVDIALIHAMQVTNARLRRSREKGRLLAEQSARLVERSDLLFQELQHRVGNNLQMVAAVLSLHLRGLDEPRARSAINDAVARIQVIGAIQRRLYRHDGEVVPLDQFIREVCDQLMRSGARPGITCSVRAESGMVLPPDAAVPMALVLAEALANALEHGFAGRETGQITIVLDHGPETVMLSVHDDGAGLPPGFDPGQADSLGLRISRILCRQLGAVYQLQDANPGCRMTLSLPAQRFASKPS